MENLCVKDGFLEGTVDELDKALEKVNAQAERVRTREAEKKNKQGQKQKGGEGNERKRKPQADSQQVSKVWNLKNFHFFLTR
jgi:hypothetical protein